MSAEPFVWNDAGRVVLLRDGALKDAPALLTEHGFEGFALLTTKRARSPSLAAAAASTLEVGPGPVPETAAALLDSIGPGPYVAHGGGRVIDTAKALAAVSGAAVAAIPTTLSGAEMTGIHRLPAGAEDRAAGLVRPRLVIADPDQMTGLAEASLRASAMNALAHSADSLYTPFANPVSRMTALRGAALIAGALDQERERRDRGALALGAILCGYAIDSGMYALHHVACQTLVRVCGTPHAETNAAILPRAMALMVTRAPRPLAELAAALETAPDGIEARILELGGEPDGLGAAGGDRDRLGEAVEAMLERPELGFTPGGIGAAELTSMVEAAW